MSRSFDSAGATPPVPDAAGCTLGIGAAMLALVLCLFGTLALLVLPSTLEKEAKAEELVLENFTEGRIPFGLEESGARAYEGIAVIVRFGREGLDEDRLSERLMWKEAAKLAGEQGAQDWKKLDSSDYADESDQSNPEEGEETGAEESDSKTTIKPKAMAALDVKPGSVDPDELLLVKFKDVKLLIAQFSTTRGGFGGFGEQESDQDVARHLALWKRDASHAWETTLMRDKVRWDGWEADFQIQRAFRVGGAWCDTAKLNLGLGKRNLALFARWPDGYVVTRQDLERIARTVQMQDPPSSGMDYFRSFLK